MKPIRALSAVLLAIVVAVPARAETVVPQSRAEITLSFAPVVKATAPAVVNIYTRKVVERRASPFAGDPFFERFFGEFFPGMGGPDRRIENSLGSGVIVDPSGIVVSNAHVVGDADEITVMLHDRREFEAEVILNDGDSDLSVLRLRGAAGLPSLALRDSDTIEVGDLVLAIGNPFGVGQTVTSGIVSGLARAVPRGGEPGSGYFIQTDAAINPGNSGGALVDMTGRLVGVNTAILSRSGGSNGIGFAIPANLVARLIEAARAGADRLARPWLGVSAQPVTSALADALGLETPRGVLIDEVHPASPLAEAGLEAGDVVLSINGAAVNAPAEMTFRVETLGPGTRVPVEFRRGEREDSVEVRLEPAPDQPPRSRQVLDRAGRLSGLEVMTVNPSVIDEFELPLALRGAYVSGVRGPARATGLRPGDVIEAVNGRPIEQVADLLGAAGASDTLVLGVTRGARRGTLRVGN